MMGQIVLIKIHLQLVVKVFITMVQTHVCLATMVATNVVLLPGNVFNAKLAGLYRQLITLFVLNVITQLGQ